MSMAVTTSPQELGWNCPSSQRTQKASGISEARRHHGSSTARDDPNHMSQQEQQQPYSRNALLSIQLASLAAQDFDNTYALRNVERELSIPLFSGQEIVLESAQPYRLSGYFHEFGLQSLKVVMDLVMDGGDNDKSTSSDGTTQQRKRRLAERVNEQPHVYSVKYLQKHVIDTEQGPEAACEMIVETKILMNLSHPSHPNLLQVFGANGEGIDSFLESGRKSFFLIVDRLQETFDQRLEDWRSEEANISPNSQGSTDVCASTKSHLLQRLEVANDVCSALVFLATRKLVYYLKPEKVGFDAKCGRVKLCDFGQARQEGMMTHSPSILRSKNSNVLAYTAPEVMLQAPATVSSDVYSFGILLWEIVSLKRPFHAYSKSDHLNRVVKQHERPQINASWPRHVCDLMQQCWDPHFRPTIKKVQDDLETALLFDDDQPKGSVPAKNDSTLDPSLTAVACAEFDSSPRTVAGNGRGRAGPSVIDQHLRRNGAPTTDERPFGSPVSSSNASVATHSTFRTRGDYSAFTHGPASPTRNLVQQQRQRRSMSRGPTRGPSRAAVDPPDFAAEPIQHDEGCEIRHSAIASDGVSRPRRLSMEIANKPSRSRSVQRVRSMSIGRNSNRTKVLTDALSQLAQADAPLQVLKDTSLPEKSLPTDATSTDTPVTVLSSDYTPDPTTISPVQRRRSSRKHPAGYDYYTKGSPAGTAATSGSSSTDSSPTSRAASASISGNGIRSVAQRRNSVRRAASLRRLVQGDVFPDLTPELTESPLNRTRGKPVPRTRGVQRSQSLVMNHPANSSPNRPLTQDTFSLDNIAQTPSPAGRGKSSRSFSFQRKPPQASRSDAGVGQLSVMLEDYNPQVTPGRELEPGHRSAGSSNANEVFVDSGVIASNLQAVSTSSPTSASSRRRMMQRAMSEREMPRRHHSYSHPHNERENNHQDRRSMRAERSIAPANNTAAGATRDSFSARLRAEMASDGVAAAAAAAHDSHGPSRVIRVKVKNRRSSKDM